MREVPVRDTDPDPYNSMAAQANQVNILQGIRAIC